MQGKPQDFMKVGIVHFMAFPETMKGDGPIVETLTKICNDDYFQAVEVTSIQDPAVRKAAIETAHNANMTVGFGAQPMLLAGKCDLGSMDVPTRQAALDTARAGLEESIEWNATAFAVLSGPDTTEANRPQATTMFISSLKELCEISRRENGPALLLHTFDRVPHGKNRLVGPTIEAVTIARKVWPFYLNFGLLLDLGHLPLLGEKPEDALRLAGQHLKHVHVGNCVMRKPDHPAYGDNHPPFGIPEGENGVDELAGFLKILLESGYIREGGERMVSFEVKPFGDMTSDEVITNAKETLDAAWAAL